jgi:hypothetical protein
MSEDRGIGMFQRRSPGKLREERPELGLVAQIVSRADHRPSRNGAPAIQPIRPQSERSALEGKLVPGARSLVLTAGL